MNRHTQLSSGRTKILRPTAQIKIPDDIKYIIADNTEIGIIKCLINSDYSRTVCTATLQISSDYGKATALKDKLPSSVGEWQHQWKPVSDLYDEAKKVMVKQR